MVDLPVEETAVEPIEPLTPAEKRLITRAYVALTQHHQTPEQVLIHKLNEAMLQGINLHERDGEWTATEATATSTGSLPFEEEPTPASSKPSSRSRKGRETSEDAP